jgi:hypothetical protein
MTKLDEQLQALTQFMPIDELRRRIASATAWLGREPEVLIPSTTIGSDGIALDALFLIDGDLIAEIKLASLYDNFDMMKLTVFNVRVTLGVQEVKVGEQVVASYHTASVTLKHSSNDGMVSVLSYAGVEPSASWLDRVKVAFPIDLLQPAT